MTLIEKLEAMIRRWHCIQKQQLDDISERDNIETNSDEARGTADGYKCAIADLRRILDEHAAENENGGE